MKTENLFHLPPLPLEQEWMDVLAKGQGVRVERIVSTGQTSSWYDQDEQEFVALLQGKATLEWGDGICITLTAGDTLLIPAHQRHRVSYTSSTPPCIWLCVFWR